ncbi:MAG: (d)CMP kinase [Rhabdochlamydiaceae bacterium]|nr:(d)CMP kinase [Candidatus Amphrikana amoebophyrae]
MIITIDGPSGTGKTTTAKRVAHELQMTYFDTGAMYRSFVWYLFDKKIPLVEDALTAEVFDNFDYDVQSSPSGEKVYIVNGKNITEEIRSNKVTQASSEVAKFAAVRHHIVHLQRKFAKSQNTVMEGRDLGSVVFPHAELKIFLTANAMVRAKRRYAQICEKYPDQAAQTSVEEILNQQSIRDSNDINRDISPLVCPNDAKEIDTSNLAIDDVVKKIVKYGKLVGQKDSIIQKFVYRSVISIIRGAMRLLYSVKVYGANTIPKGSAILASNHVSFLDPPILAVCSSTPLHFLARATLFKHFLFGRFIKYLNAHPISGGVNDVSLFNEIEKLILQGKNVLMFPEGRRSRDGKLQPFKRGLGWIVSRTGAHVVPVYLDGAFEAWPRKRKLPFIFKKITCVFGKPLYFPREGKLTEKGFHDKISKQVYEKVAELKLWVEGDRKGPLP